MDSQYVRNKTISIIIVMINGTSDLSQKADIINAHAKINRIHTCTRVKFIKIYFEIDRDTAL